MAAPTADTVRPFDPERLGPRARRRAEPRASIAVAGAGCLLAVVGALMVGFDAADHGGKLDLLPGLALCAALLAAGLGLQARFRHGPVAAAGTVAVVLGIPTTLLFGLHLLDDGIGFSPIVVLSTLAWLGAYLAGGGRGRPVYLAAAAGGLWAFVLETLGDLDRLPLLVFPVVTFDRYYDDEYSSFGRGDVFGRPSLTTTALLSLAVGAAYVVVSRRLDQRGAAGMATPLLATGIPAVALGCLALADELHPAGAGVVAIVLGGVLAAHGASVGRRATTWIGAALVAAGAAAVLGDLSDDTAVGGVLLLLGGLGLVAGAHAVATRLHEPHELPDPPVQRRRLVAKPAADVAPEA